MWIGKISHPVSRFMLAFLPYFFNVFRLCCLFVIHLANHRAYFTMRYYYYHQHYYYIYYYFIIIFISISIIIINFIGIHQVMKQTFFTTKILIKNSTRVNFQYTVKYASILHLIFQQQHHIISHC